MYLLVVVVIYIYIYICGYNLFAILYTSVVLVWMIEYRTSQSQYYMSGVILSLKNNGYKIIHSRSSFVFGDVDC